MRHFPIFLPFLLLILLFSEVGLAQNGSDTLWVWREKPVVVQGFNAFTEDYYSTTFYLGAMGITRPLGEGDAGVTAQFRQTFADRLLLQLRFDHHANKRFDSQYRLVANNPQVVSDNELKPYFAAEFMLGFNFYKQFDNKRKVHIRTRDSYGKIQEIDLEKEVPVRKYLGLRAGAVHYNSMVNNYLLDEPFMADDQGVVLYEGGPIDLRHRDPGPTFFTNFTCTALAVGINFKWLAAYRYTLENRAIYKEMKRTKTDLYNVYADFFPFSVVDMAPIQYQGAEYNVLHDGEGGFHYRDMGFRIGVETEGYRFGRHGLSYQLEGGVRPGITNVSYPIPPFGNRMYLQARIAWMFGVN